MKKITTAVGLFVAVIVAGYTNPPDVIAQDRPAQSVKPHAMMQKLAPLTGQWRMATEITEDGGKNWQQVAEELINFEIRHKGMLLAETPISRSETGFNMENYITYDQYREVYRSVAIDDSWGIMDIYEGNFIGDTLVLTNLKSGTSFPVGDGKWRSFRLNINVEANLAERRMLIEGSDDGGATWAPAFRVTYYKQ